MMLLLTVLRTNVVSAKPARPSGPGSAMCAPGTRVGGAVGVCDMGAPVSCRPPPGHPDARGGTSAVTGVSSGGALSGRGCSPYAARAATSGTARATSGRRSGWSDHRVEAAAVDLEPLGQVQPDH